MMTYPTLEETREQADRAEAAAMDYYASLHAIWWHHGPRPLPGSPADRRYLTASAARRAWEDIRRELYPTQREVDYLTDARRAWAALEAAGIDPAPWEYMGGLRDEHGRLMWELCHADRRTATYTGPRTLYIVAPQGTPYSARLLSKR